MIWTIVLILVILWALGFFVANIGSIVHVLLVVALVAIVYNLITGRRGNPL